jgi:hypothetical protein
MHQREVSPVNIRTTYENAAVQHSEVVSVLMGRLAKSRSKYKHLSPADLEWHYSIAFRIDCACGGLSPIPCPSFEKDLEELLSRAEVCLYCQVPSKTNAWAGGVKLFGIPKEAEEKIVNFVQNRWRGR